MANQSIELQKRLLPDLRAGDLAQCERTVAAQLATIPASPFHIILDLSITNAEAQVATFFDDFFRSQPYGLVNAAYTEMNGFDINPNLWFCSPFAYQRYGGHEDYDWLSDWQSEFDGYLPITGLEAIQEVYASDAFQDKRYREASDVTGLLVVTKFQDLIRRAGELMHELHFPLLATAHDYEFIYEFRKNPD